MVNLIHRIYAPALVLAVLALALYLPGFWWGAPYASAADRTHAWGVDDETPLGAIGEVYHNLTHSHGGNLGYPLMYYYVVTAAAVPYLGYLWLTHQISGISATYPFGLTDPVTTLQVLSWIAHFVSVVMGVGTVVAAYDTARILWDRRTGFLAALLVMVSYPMFYYSRTGNVDVPVLFFSALALDFYARSLVDRFTVRRAIGLGISVGFALATKESAVALFISIPVILMVQRLKSRDRWFSPTFWKAPLTAVTATGLAFGLGSGFFLDPQRFIAHLQFSNERIGDLAAGKIAFASYFPFTWEGHLQLSELITRYLAASMSWLGLLLAILGIAWSLHQRSKSFFFALLSLTYLIILFWSARTAQLRYVMPATFVLSFFAAYTLIRAWDSRARLLQYAAAALAFSILAVSVLQGLDLTFTMLHDSRYAAAAWLAEHTQVGDRIEYFGYPDHLPALPTGVITARTPVNLDITTESSLAQYSVEEIKEGWVQRSPRYIIILPDLLSAPGTPYSGFCPPQIYDALEHGTLGYHLVAYFQTPRLIPWLPEPELDYPVVNPPIRIFERTNTNLSS